MIPSSGSNRQDASVRHVPSLEPSSPSNHGDPAKRGFGVVDASLLVVGSIVGAGIFLVSPFVAADVSSPAAFIGTWVIGGAIALSGALSNGELGGMFPRSGGEYVYLTEAYGSPIGFLSGWTSFWIAFPGSIAALAWGFGNSVAGMCGLGPSASTAIGTFAIGGLTILNAFGLHPGRVILNALTATKLAAFAFLLGLGLLARPVLVPSMHQSLGTGAHPAGMAVALIPVLFAYSGWNAATYITGEMRDPARSLGWGLAVGTATCILLYVLVNVTYLRALPVAELRQTTDPARVTASRLGGALAAGLLAPLVALCILSSLQATVLVGPRLYHAMAADGLFFRPLGRVHGPARVPVIALAVQAIVAVAELFSGRFEQLLTFAMFAIIAFSTLTVVAVFVLRTRRPDWPRPFRVPGYPVAPALFVAMNVWVLSSVLERGMREALIGAAIVATGLPAYVIFRARKRAQELSQ
ncbi:MAG: amino acid permease [Polyangiaceae bacterium]|jgi:APA family basic amino acid/polyamine antiporter